MLNNVPQSHIIGSRSVDSTPPHTSVSPRCISVLFFCMLDTVFTFSSEKFTHLILNAVCYSQTLIGPCVFTGLRRQVGFLCIEQSAEAKHVF